MGASVAGRRRGRAFGTANDPRLTQHRAQNASCVDVGVTRLVPTCLRMAASALGAFPGSRRQSVVLWMFLKVAKLASSTKAQAGSAIGQVALLQS